MLALPIDALVRHTRGRAALAALRALPALRELHVSMHGNLAGTHVEASGGLPPLPQLTRLVMTLDGSSVRHA